MFFSFAFRTKSVPFCRQTSFNNFIQSDKSTAADKEDICSIYFNELLLGMFSSALRWNIGNRPFQYFKQPLLDAFTRNISGNRRILGFSGNLIYLINVDNTPLSFFYIIVGILK